MKNTGNYVFVGLAIIGVGLGFALDNIVVGSVIGVGIGFLALAYFNNKAN